MSGRETLRWWRAKIDRLPRGWVLIVLGFLGHLAIAGAQTIRAVNGDDQVSTVVAAFLVGIVLAGGIATLPTLVLLWLGRLERIAALMAVAVGAGMLFVNDAHPTVWPYPIALFVAAVRIWAGARLDAADLLELDPVRFDRVDPPSTATDATDDQSSQETPRET